METARPNPVLRPTVEGLREIATRDIGALPGEHRLTIGLPICRLHARRGVGLRVRCEIVAEAQTTWWVWRRCRMPRSAAAGVG
jgi:hypothetical protein